MDAPASASGAASAVAHADAGADAGASAGARVGISVGAGAFSGANAGARAGAVAGAAARVPAAAGAAVFGAVFGWAPAAASGEGSDEAAEAVADAAEAMAEGAAAGLSLDQGLVLGLLAVTMGLFLWGRWRHDVVALAALMASVALGLVPAEGAFAGFGHPAVITVACVLVLSRGLQNSGAVDLLARSVLPAQGGRLVSMAALLALGAGLSAFMNNVGAMALLMPVAVQLAGRLELTPGQVLMPLAFGTILGGMTTLVGTPPNLIVSGFRADAGLGAFGMFAFTPVGLAVAATGVAFVVALGWRLVPAKRGGAGEEFTTAAYFTEVRVPETGKAVGLTLRAVEEALGDAEAQVVGLVRNEVRMFAPHGGRVVRAGDILVLEADVDGLAETLSKLDLKLEEEGPSSEEAEAGKPKRGEAEAGAAEGEGRASRKLKAAAGKAAEATRKTIARTGTARAQTEAPGEAAGEASGEAAAAGGSGKGVSAGSEDGAGDRAENDTGSGNEKPAAERGRSADVVLRELAVLPASSLVGRSATDVRLRSRYGLNLLAVSREGGRPRTRLRSLKLRVGDVLLVQGPAEVLTDFAAETGCVPLAERSLRLPDRRSAALSVAIMAGAVALATAGVLPAAVAFALGVLVSMLARTVPPRLVYTAIDWPVIVLLAALIPVAGAMEATGMALWLAEALVRSLPPDSPVLALTALMVLAILLSNIVNNAATAAVMAPIALGIAATLGVNADSFLMAVAFGASAAFLTPIGHQNNTLILGPGGFSFADYWRLGLPLEALVVAVSVPMILLVWPL